MKKPWYRSKTVWTGIVAIITSLGGYLCGEITAVELLRAVFSALMVIFFRIGVEDLKRRK